MARRTSFEAFEFRTTEALLFVDPELNMTKPTTAAATIRTAAPMMIQDRFDKRRGFGALGLTVAETVPCSGIWLFLLFSLVRACLTFGRLGFRLRLNGLDALHALNDFTVERLELFFGPRRRNDGNYGIGFI